jgi:serine/threonine protein phosphatase PrpC
MSGARLAKVELGVALATDVGRHRLVNEDSILAERPVFVVADGMGGYDAGDRASQAVVAAFRDVLCAGNPVELGAIRIALSAADEGVAAVAAQTERGAGSTVTGVVLLEREGEPYWLIINVGDSRVYRHIGAELEQLTVDHSLAQELVDVGELTARSRRDFAERNVITRAIGAADSRADSWLMPVTTGERILICSDGLHGELPDEEIRALLTMSGRPAAAASSLIDAALRAGGHDNISVIVLDVIAGGAVSSPDLTGASQSAPLISDDEEGDTVPE